MLVTLEVSDDHVSLICKDLEFDQRRRFDPEIVAGLSQDYRDAVDKSDGTQLLDTGRALYRWVDAGEGWLAALRANLQPPFELEIAATLNPSPQAMTLLQAPWEILADELGFLARDAILQFAPARRLGKAAPIGPADDFRLGVAFMASSPRSGGGPELDFEAEESAIISATRQGLDLLVEDSGDPDQFSERLAAVEHRPPVLHLSCHGHNAWTDQGSVAPRPILLMENERGEPQPVDAGSLIATLNPYRPRLLFLSACLTAAGGASNTDSMACALIRAGLPAVLGWDGSVADSAATAFAHYFYEGLAKRQPSAQAAAAARTLLLDARDPGSEEANWHLARIWFGPQGGPPIVAGRRKRSLLPPDHGHKQLLVRKGNDRLAVADPALFVGRRHELQQALRALKGDDDSGLLVHGMGRLGKSSLAARIANRMREHRLVIVYGAYDALSVLDALAKELSDYPPARDLLAARRPLVRDNPAALQNALIDLLYGPCSQHGEGCPILLLVDDLERILEFAQPPGKYRIRPAERQVIAALLQAFDPARSESRLLMTSRFPFELVVGGVALEQRLSSLQLPPFDARAQAKLRLRQLMSAGHRSAGGKSLDEDEIGERAPLLVEAATLARGNPGLQDLIGDKLILNAAVDLPSVKRVLAEMEGYLSGGDLPEAEDVRAFLQELAVDELLAQAGEDGRTLLAAATLFDLPIPREVLEKVSQEVGGSVDRIRDLGLLDPSEDLMDPAVTSFAVNGLAAGRLGKLPADSSAAIATIATPILYDAWGGLEGRKDRPYSADILLAKLSVLAGNAAVAQTCAPDAVSGLIKSHRPAAAAALGLAAISAIEEGSERPGLRLLAFAGEALETVGEGEQAQSVLAKGADRLADAANQDQADLSNYLLRLGNSQLRQGFVDEAEATFERLCQLLKDSGHELEYASARGRLAFIFRQRGDLEEALRIHRDEQLPIFTRLNELRSIALTQGHIADILFVHQDYDEALRIRREQELPVYARIGDTHSFAVTQGQIADILIEQGQYDEALRLLRDELLPIFARLGDVGAYAGCQSRIAEILAAQGNLVEARRLLEERLQTARKLQDVDGIASALFDIAKLDLAEESYGEALPRLEEAWPILLALDRAEGLAAVGEMFGLLLHGQGRRDEAVSALSRSAAAYRKLGREAEAVSVEQFIQLIEEDGLNGEESGDN